MNFSKGRFSFVVIFLVLLLPFLVYSVKAQFEGDLGSISGAVSWDTETSITRFRIKFTGNNTGYTTFRDSSNTSGNFSSGGFTLPPDVYTLSVYKYQDGVPNNLGYYTGLTQTVTIGSGQEVTGVNFDLSSATGLVRGNLTINGSLSSGYVQFCGPLITDPCPISSSGDPFHPINGTLENFGGNGFQVPVLPGDYRVHVATNNNVSVGIVPVTVSAGQISQDSSLQFQLNLGSISGNVSWNAETSITRFRVKFLGNSTGFMMFRDSSSTSGNFSSGGFTLPPDTYVLSVYKYQSDAANNLGYNTGLTQTITVNDGESVTGVNFNLANTTGLVRGSLTINDSLSSGYVQFCGPLITDPCPISSSGNPFNSVNGTWETFNGNGFQVPVLPGEYRVHVATSNNLNVGIVPVTVSAGQISQDVTLQFQLNLGSIFGTVSWDAETSITRFRIKFSGNNTGYITFRDSSAESGNFSSGGFTLPPDTYILTVHKYQSDAPNNLGYDTGLTQTITVGDGQSITDVNFNLANTTGLVKGSLVINGLLSGGYVQFCSSQTSCPISSSGNPFNFTNGTWENFNGNGFQVPVLSGNYWVHVSTFHNVDMGIIPIKVNVGEVIDLLNISVSVPMGQNVAVSLDGIEVTFAEVTASGFMSVFITTHPQGGHPPSQYRFLGTYYELTTTATYTGPVTVSFTYDDADVRGREENLKLFHWDGVEWVNITVSVDTVNNVITGVTPTLSPFAIGDLLNSPPTVDAGGPYSVDEEGMVQVTATGQDPENGPLTYAWDLDNNGSFETPGQTVTFSAASLNPGVYTIAVQVTDNGNLTASDQTTVTVVRVDKMATGSYVGDGAAGRSITGLGFQPDIVIIKVNYLHPVDQSLSSAVMRTSSMPGNNAKPLKGDRALAANLIQSLDVDGFTVGNELRVNDATTCGGPCTYYWEAFKAGSNTKVGTYLGNGAATQDITSGFTFSPEYVVVMPQNNRRATERSHLFGSNSNPFNAGGPVLDSITAVLANGFRVGSTYVNTSGITYYYVAWNEAPGWMKVGSYIGDKSDNRSISGVGFQPEYVIVQSAIGGRDPIQRSDAMVGDASVNFRNVLNANRIQALEADGFQVGSYTGVNASLEDFFYVAFNK